MSYTPPRYSYGCPESGLEGCAWSWNSCGDANLYVEATGETLANVRAHHMDHGYRTTIYSEDGGQEQRNYTRDPYADIELRVKKLRFSPIVMTLVERIQALEKSLKLLRGAVAAVTDKELRSYFLDMTKEVSEIGLNQQPKR